MQNLLNKSTANELQSILYDIHLSILNQMADKDRISGLPVLVEAIGNIRTKIFFNVIGNCLRELAKRNVVIDRELVSTSKKLEIICQYCNVTEATFHHIKRSLIYSHKDIHYYDTLPYDRTKNQYKYIIRNAAALIYFTSGIKILNKIRRIYEDDNNLSSNDKKTTKNEFKLEVSERQNELYKIPTPRLPILLLLDSSISMAKENRISELNEGVGWLNSALLNDTITKDVIELNIITFNDSVKEVLPFGRLLRQQQFIKAFRMEAIGTKKKLGGAIHLALMRMHEVKIEYKDAALDYHQPWIIIVTDCEKQYLDEYKEMANRLVELENKKKVNVIPVAVGSGDISLAQELTNKNKAIRMSAQTFPIFFEWIYKNAAFFAKSEDDKPKFSPIMWGTIE